ncbi:substrate-binding periplasmic protein [Paraglaciecola hydrolytica]|uniref:Amino acid ABC transporter substrate-binding protein n=1 Tax=Paraglaciecola hydrolytica TaxID=1799789 RepID=A0A136A323_9ALTE|nr:transporter substrate-binding domain-containing protein [Paraglaciecola hydrolytica]KXI29635.1 amino acid ABC transporter substrate-binding protein [Paraglaciecola hydrolytica]
MSTLRLLLSCTAALILCNCQPVTTEKTNPLSSTETAMIELVAPETNDSCHFVVGFDAWEPYQYIDVGDKVTGLDIELVSAVLKSIECDFSFKSGTWMALMGELKKGEVDILLGASKTPAREEFALFSNAYRTEEYSLYIRREDLTTADYSSIDAFIEKGKLIGVVEDYYYGPEVSMLRDGAATSSSFVSAIMGEVNIARLLDKDIDGFLEDSFVGASFLRRKALSEYIVAQGTKIKTGDTHIIFSKKSVDETKVELFNQALHSIKTSDQYQEIVSRYSQ